MTDNMMLITLFDTLYPCWDREMLEAEGADMEAVASLAGEGLLDARGGVYSLTEAGAEEFRRAALENFLDEKPGKTPEDRARSVRAAKFLKKLDAAHAQRWGIKQYYTRPRLEMFPKVPEGGLFRVDGGKLSWPYMESADERGMEETFVPGGLWGRKERLEAACAKSAAWTEAHRALIDVYSPDVFYVCRYDHRCYDHFKPHPNDPMRLVNTDRFAFVFDGGVEAEELEEISKFRRWVTFMRRVVLTDYFDIDEQEQDSVSVLYLVSAKEAEAEERAERLSRFGAALTEGAEPFEIWTLSEEALFAVRDRREVVWELLPHIARPVRRMEACGCCRV